jgi:Ca-activated chloride channel family protein
MSFQWPLALLGLLVVPLLVGLYVVRERRRARFAARFANPALLPNLVDRPPGRLRHFPLAVLLVALAAMLVGVARPQATITKRHEEATVILAVDVSRSMGANDVRPTRLAAARAAAKAFLRDVPEKYRVGVVSFANRAVVGLPPTHDRTLAREALDSLRLGQGTTLGDAVVLAAQLGQRARAADGSVPPTSILLISDGKNEGGRATPAAAARRARALRVPVYTVVLGTTEGRVTRTLPGGFREIVRVPPSPETLRGLAQATGGRFFTATDDEGLRAVYEQLGSRLGSHKETREITDVFAAGAAALLLAGAGLSAFWFRKVL